MSKDKNKRRKEIIKKLFVGVFLFLFFLSSSAFAWEVEYPGLPPSPNLSDYLLYIFNLAIFLGGIVALLMIVIGGIEYMTSAGNVARMSDAKDRILKAVLGLVLLFCSYVILSVINPELTLVKLPFIAPLKISEKEGLAYNLRVTDMRLQASQAQVEATINKLRSQLETTDSLSSDHQNALEDALLKAKNISVLRFGAYFSEKQIPVKVPDRNGNPVDRPGRWVIFKENSTLILEKPAENPTRQGKEGQEVPYLVRTEEGRLIVGDANRDRKIDATDIDGEEGIEFRLKDPTVAGLPGKVITINVPAILKIEKPSEEKDCVRDVKFGGPWEGRDRSWRAMYEKGKKKYETVKVLEVEAPTSDDTDFWNALQQKIKDQYPHLNGNQITTLVNEIKNDLVGTGGNPKIKDAIFYETLSINDLLVKLHENPDGAKSLEKDVKVVTENTTSIAEEAKKALEEGEEKIKEQKSSLHFAMSLHQQMNEELAEEMGKENLEAMKEAFLSLASTLQKNQIQFTSLFYTLAFGPQKKAEAKETEKIKDPHAKFGEILNGISEAKYTSFEITSNTSKAERLLSTALSETKELQKIVQNINVLKAQVAQASGLEKKKLLATEKSALKKADELVKKITAQVRTANQILEAVNSFLGGLENSLNKILQDMIDLQRAWNEELTVKRIGKVSRSLMVLGADLLYFAEAYGGFGCKLAEKAKLTKLLETNQSLTPVFEDLVSFGKDVVDLAKDFSLLVQEWARLEKNLAKTETSLRVIAGILREMANIVANVPYVGAALGTAILTIQKVFEIASKATQYVLEWVIIPVGDVLETISSTLNSVARPFKIVLEIRGVGEKPLYVQLVALLSATAIFIKDFIETPQAVDANTSFIPILEPHIRAFRAHLQIEALKIVVAGDPTLEKLLDDAIRGTVLCSTPPCPNLENLYQTIERGKYDLNLSLLNQNVRKFVIRVNEIVIAFNQKLPASSQREVKKIYNLSDMLLDIASGLKYLGDTLNKICSGGVVNQSKNLYDQILNILRSNRLDDPEKLEEYAKIRIEKGDVEAVRDRGYGKVYLFSQPGCKGNYVVADTKGAPILKDEGGNEITWQPRSILIAGEGIARVCTNYYFGGKCQLFRNISVSISQNPPVEERQIEYLDMYDTDGNGTLREWLPFPVHYYRNLPEIELQCPNDTSVVDTCCHYVTKGRIVVDTQGFDVDLGGSYESVQKLCDEEGQNCKLFVLASWITDDNSTSPCGAQGSGVCPTEPSCVLTKRYTAIEYPPNSGIFHYFETICTVTGEGGVAGCKIVDPRPQISAGWTMYPFQKDEFVKKYIRIKAQITTDPTRNIAKFVLEHSDDNINWTTLGSVWEIREVKEVPADVQCADISLPNARSARFEASLDVPVILFAGKNFTGRSEVFNEGCTTDMGEVGSSPASIFVKEGYLTVLCRDEKGDCGPKPTFGTYRYKLPYGQRTIYYFLLPQTLDESTGTGDIVNPSLDFKDDGFFNFKQVQKVCIFTDNLRDECKGVFTALLPHRIEPGPTPYIYPGDEKNSPGDRLLREVKYDFYLAGEKALLRKAPLTRHRMCHDYGNHGRCDYCNDWMDKDYVVRKTAALNSIIGVGKKCHVILWTGGSEEESRGYGNMASYDMDKCACVKNGYINGETCSNPSSNLIENNKTWPWSIAFFLDGHKVEFFRDPHGYIYDLGTLWNAKDDNLFDIEKSDIGIPVALGPDQAEEICDRINEAFNTQTEAVELQINPSKSQPLRCAGVYKHTEVGTDHYAPFLLGAIKKILINYPSSQCRLPTPKPACDDGTTFKLNHIYMFGRGNAVFIEVLE